MTTHELRHSLITLMLSQGERISVVAQMVGQSNVSLMLSKYRQCDRTSNGAWWTAWSGW